MGATPRLIIIQAATGIALDGQSLIGLFAIAAMAIGGAFAFSGVCYRSLATFKDDHMKVHETQAHMIERLRTEVELHDAFITPLNTVFQQHLATALFRTNPFTAAENAAAQRYLDAGPRAASDADLIRLRLGLQRVLTEVDKDVDKLVYGGLLAGIAYELRRRYPLPKSA